MDESGKAVLDHSIGYRVVRGPLHRIDIVDVDTKVTPQSKVTIVSEDGPELEGQLEVHGERTLRITVAEPKAIKRGKYTFRARYSVDFVETRALARSLSGLVLTYTSPRAEAGYDGVRTTFDFPAAPTEPVAVRADTGLLDEAALTTLRRGEARDELLFVRTHVARGELPTYHIRLDARALPRVALGPAPEPDHYAGERTRVASDDERAWVKRAGGALLWGVLLSALVLVKGRRAPDWPSVGSRRFAHRGLLAFAAGGFGMWILLGGGLVLGATILAVLGTILAIHPNRASRALRGPGRWLALAREDACSPGDEAPRGSFADPSSRRGKVALAGGGLVAVAGLAALSVLEPAWVVPSALAVVGMVPLALSGASRMLPAAEERRARERIIATSLSLARETRVRCHIWGRVPDGSMFADEVRLRVLPRLPVPGLGSMELAWSAEPGPLGFVSAWEVLVRVVDGSPAHEQLHAKWPGVLSTLGRKPEERVLRLPVPPDQSLECAVLEVADRMTDRRRTVIRYTGIERRRGRVADERVRLSA